MGASYCTVDCILKFAITEFVNSLSVNVTWTNIENMIVVVVYSALALYSGYRDTFIFMP